MSVDDSLIGFLGLFGASDEGAVVRAALLVSDGRGYPQEFRIATPVRPNTIQRSLYGSRLNEFIISDILATPLLKDIKVTPTFIVANRREALTARSPYPMLYVTEAAGFVPLPRERSRSVDLPQGRADVVLVQLSDVAEAGLDDAATILEAAHNAHDVDPFEVFDRILVVIEQLAQEDRRYRA